MTSRFILAAYLLYFDLHISLDMEIEMIKELRKQIFYLLFVFLLVNMRYLYAADEPFNVTIELQSPIVLSEINGLSFVSTPTGMNTDVVTAPRDALAATFSVRGNPNTAVTGSVVESSITMTTGAGGINEQIVVDNFTTTDFTPRLFNDSIA